MKFTNHFLFATFFTITFCNSQTVMNAENLRVEMLKGKENWAGQIGVWFNVTKNTNDIVDLSTNVAVGYNGGKNLWMIMSKIDFNKTAGEAFENSGSQHFRYNRELIEDKIALEVFAQGQYDKISNIDFRGLAGIGPRFDLSKADNKNEIVKDDNVEIRKKSRFFIGTLIMYEYEKSSEVDLEITQKDLRSSNYFSFTFYPTRGLTIISTTYYQPKIDLLKDYRISSDININIKFLQKIEQEKEETKPKSFWEKISFNVSFSYNYDAFPVSAIPNSQYSLTNGLSFNF